MPELRIVDVFAGCGGFSLGAHMAGMKTCLAVDVDPILSSSYSRNFPGVKLLRRNVRRISSVDLMEHAGGRIDGIVGGPPCQGFSEIGRRDIEDPRSLLIGDFFRLVKKVRPRFFVMENVRGLAFDGSRTILLDYLEGLDRYYTVFGPSILEASAFGAATRRPRLFVIGIAGPGAGASIFQDELARTKTEAATVRDAINDLRRAKPSHVDGRGLDWWTYPEDETPSDYAIHARKGRGGKQLTYVSSHRRTVHLESTIRRFSRLRPGARDPVGKHERLKWNGQSPTIRAGTGSDRGSYQSVRPIHPVEPRVITPREAARLQGFPDWFELHPTIWHSFRMIGNSVSPFIARAVLQAVRRCL
jgi:DNA (cytosine-5)-methyltransferase 1